MAKDKRDVDVSAACTGMSDAGVDEPSVSPASRNHVPKLNLRESLSNLRQSLSPGGAHKPRSLSGRGLSGVEKKQLAQLFEKDVDDQGCATILNVSVDLVREFRSQRVPAGWLKVPANEVPSPDRRLADREEGQLRKLFERQVSPDSCAKILYICPDAVTTFKANEKEGAKAEPKVPVSVTEEKVSPQQRTPQMGTPVKKIVAQAEARKAEALMLQPSLRTTSAASTPRTSWTPRGRKCLQPQSGSQEDVTKVEAEQKTAKARQQMLAAYGNVLTAAKLEADARQQMLVKAERGPEPPIGTGGATALALRIKAFASGANVHRLTHDPAFRSSAACAAVGTVGGALTGGGTGTVLGGICGAAAGIGPAFLTSGMSIPISTGIGSGIGLCIGTLSGATVGAIAGGASGYAGFTYRKQLQEGRAKVLSKARHAVEMLGIKSKLQQGPLKSDGVALAGQ